MKMKIYSIVFSIFFSVTNLALSADTMLFNANGHRLNPPEEPSLQYQWTDPKTGQIITREYPPANLKMHQVERRGNLVILEIIGKHKFADAVNLKTPQSAETASQPSTAINNCLTAAQERFAWKDRESVRIEGEPIKTTSTDTGEVRQALILSVNAKNSYGAYSGAEYFQCILGTDNLTPIKVSKWP